MNIAWHRIFGVALTQYLAGSAWQVLLWTNQHGSRLARVASGEESKPGQADRAGAFPR